MSLLLALILLLLLHFITGYGIVHLFSIKLKPLPLAALSTIVGILVASFVPFLLQLCYIPVTTRNILVLWLLLALVLNLKTLLQLRRGIRPKPGRLLPKIKLYELPAILMLTFIISVGAWRGYYYPSYTRDGMSGPEAISEYAVKEHTLINSVFQVNLETTNNQFKSPFLTDLQLIYKLAGFPFGNVWLSLLVVSFFIFLYYSLSEKLHKVLTGLLLVAFIATPEAYGYTFLTLYDYSNMILLFLGFHYLFSFFKSKQLNEFYFSALLMAFSVYIRSETLILIIMLTPFLLFSFHRLKVRFGTSVLHILAFLSISTICYYVPVEIYNNLYLPQTYAVDNLLNKDLLNFGPFFDRLYYMTGNLMFGEKGIMLWAHFMYIFAFFFLIELIFKRSFTGEARNWLLGVLVIYLGLPLLGYLIPIMDLENSTKRGLIKILPLMLLYMGNNQLLIKLSERIGKWETG